MLIEMHQKCSAASTFGEKADSVSAVKHNTECKAAVNTTCTLQRPAIVVFID